MKQFILMALVLSQFPSIEKMHFCNGVGVRTVGMAADYMNGYNYCMTSSDTEELMKQKQEQETK